MILFETYFIINSFLKNSSEDISKIKKNRYSTMLKLSIFSILACLVCMSYQMPAKIKDVMPDLCSLQENELKSLTPVGRITLQVLINDISASVKDELAARLPYKELQDLKNADPNSYSKLIKLFGYKEENGSIVVDKTYNQTDACIFQKELNSILNNLTPEGEKAFNEVFNKMKSIDNKTRIELFNKIVAKNANEIFALTISDGAALQNLKPKIMAIFSELTK